MVPLVIETSGMTFPDCIVEPVMAGVNCRGEGRAVPSIPGVLGGGPAGVVPRRLA